MMNAEDKAEPSVTWPEATVPSHQQVEATAPEASGSEKKELESDAPEPEAVSPVAEAVVPHSVGVPTPMLTAPRSSPSVRHPSKYMQSSPVPTRRTATKKTPKKKANTSRTSCRGTGGRPSPAPTAAQPTPCTRRTYHSQPGTRDCATVVQRSSDRTRCTASRSPAPAAATMAQRTHSRRVLGNSSRNSPVRPTSSPARGSATVGASAFTVAPLPHSSQRCTPRSPLTPRGGATPRNARSPQTPRGGATPRSARSHTPRGTRQEQNALAHSPGVLLQGSTYGMTGSTPAGRGGSYTPYRTPARSAGQSGLTFEDICAERAKLGKPVAGSQARVPLLAASY